MHTRRLIASLALLLCATFALPHPQSVRAAPASQAAQPMLTRFMLISATLTTMHVEVDGQRIFRQPTNTLSTYVPIPSGRSITVAIYASGRVDGPDNSPIKLIRETTATFVAGTALEILNDASVLLGSIEPDPPPADQGQLWIEHIFGGVLPIITFGNQRFRAEGQFGSTIVANVAPETALLEARSDDGGLLASRYLRVQPGYRYTVIFYTRTINGAFVHELLVAATSPQLIAYPTETRLYKETGHVLEGRFQQYWDQTGGLPVFGYPLNDDHLEQTSEGTFISQVFERNRFEYHRENRAPYDVLLGRLGDEQLRRLGRDWRAEYTARPIATECEAVLVDRRQFALCEPFRTYYRTHGLEFDGQAGIAPAESLALLGLPLTQAQIETNSSGDRVLTQWFERARLEYHPNNPATAQVLLGRLGAEVYDLQPFTFDDEDRAFERFFTREGAPDWREQRGGISNHFWWSCGSVQNPGRGGSDDLAVRWVTPRLSGEYTVEAYIPAINSLSRNVTYEITAVADQTIGHTIDQRANRGTWVRIGQVGLNNVLRVQLSTVTDEPGPCAGNVVADAIRLRPR